MGYNARRDAVLHHARRARGGAAPARACACPPAAARTRRSSPTGSACVDRRHRSGRAALARCDELAGVTSHDRAASSACYLSPEHARGERARRARGCARPGSPSGRTPRATSSAGWRARTTACPRSCSAPTWTPCPTPAGTTACSACCWRSRSPSGSRTAPRHAPVRARGRRRSPTRRAPGSATPCSGSRAFAGTLGRRLAGSRTDDDGITAARRVAGVRARSRPALGDAARRPDDLVGYLEAHIEQGPHLLDAGAPLGVVTSIAGARRFALHDHRRGRARRRHAVRPAPRRARRGGASSSSRSSGSADRDRDASAPSAGSARSPAG